MNQVEKQIDNGFKWYSLRVISGKELDAKENILFEAETEKAIVYMNNNDESQKYALQWNGYNETERYYSSIIPIMDNLDLQIKAIHKNKSRSSDYYTNLIASHGISVQWKNDFDSFSKKKFSKLSEKTIIGISNPLNSYIS